MKTTTLTEWPDGTPVTAATDSWEVAFAWELNPVAVDHDRDVIFVHEAA